MPTDDSLPTSGLIDGRYQVLECVGQGGMARVYRAEDTLLGRTVAIKLLRAELEGDGSTAGRARGEMTALASLNHPALVTLYDAQLVPGRPEYLVMEFVDGPTLAERIRQGPIAPGEVAAIAADLAEALHVVHSAGIVHRDIKPSNVLMSRAPFPASRSGAKLADFGISVLVDAARLTSPGIVIGTAAYIAPEQLKGAMPAPPADIYSLGLVVLEALTGARAFPQSEGIGAAMARLTTVPEVPADLGAGWSGLLTAMTALDPGDRPSAADVFAAASDLTRASTPPPRPTIPAAVAAAALAAGAAPAVAASADASAAAPTDAVTAVMGASTGVTAASSGAVPEESADAGSTRVLPTVPGEREEAAPGSRTKRRRLGVVGAAAAAAAAASILAGVWMSGNAVPEPAATRPADTGKSPATTIPSAPVETPDADVPDDTKGDRQSKEDRKAEDEAAKKAAEAAKKAEEEQRKAEEEARKQAEDAAKQAEEEQQENEAEQQENEEEQTPGDGTGETTAPSPSPTG